MAETLLPSLINQLENSVDYRSNIPYFNCTEEKNADFVPFPKSIDPLLVEVLQRRGINALYSHQGKALELIQSGENIVISTGTASGKSLCYQIPILNSIIKSGASKSLLLFPTKALAYDQLNSLNQFSDDLRNTSAYLPKITPSIYDGDTPTYTRSTIRENATFLLTNPDMLHLGILPHHTSWQSFFSQLDFIVIDEVHIYRGVFGSHVANVLRRLKRITDFYGSKPKYILTSATISNPQQHAEQLSGQKVHIVDHDGSPHGKKYFLLYNPPIIHEELGVRQGIIQTSVQFSELILKNNIQTLLFSRSRRSVEMIIHEIHILFPGKSPLVRGYRSGYLKSERREIEDGLKNGKIKLAIATNALELGVDIGGVDLVLMAGYPGSISSTRQRAGRAGRKNKTSASILIASANPLDQFLCRHPEYIMDRNPEMALIDPDNPLILLQHLQCAAFELPFCDGDFFGSVDSETLIQFLQVLESQGILINRNGNITWLSQEYPSSNVSLRSTATRNISLRVDSGDEDNSRIGDLDYASCLWMAHPGAIYLHEGEPYIVRSLDLEANIAHLEPSQLPYYTEPVKSQAINIIQDFNHDHFDSYDIHFSEIEVNTQVTGYKQIDWNTREILNIESIDMPVTTLRTNAFWIKIDPKVVEKMRHEKMWLSDPNDYGSTWEKQRNLSKQRDQYRCTLCGAAEGEKPLHVHHKIPFKLFTNPSIANDINNLVTLCQNCHRLVEMNVKIRSAISGLNYSLFHLAPLLVMCDENDLGSFADPAADFADRQPVILIYDAIPAGMGLSHVLYTQHKQLFMDAMELIKHCECDDGCPSCVGPISEAGIGGKKETLHLLELLLGAENHG
jgi:DEAD/DEAH box helicase domain-containing protein